MIAHHLHLEFLPAEQRLLDQHLGHGRKIEPARDDLLEFLPVVSNAAARPAERVGRAHDERKPAEVRADLARLLDLVRDSGARHVEPDLDHAVLEKLAVLPFRNRSGIRPDELDAVLDERAACHKLHCGIERRLAAEGGQNRVGPLTCEDFLDHLGRDRLDVGPGGELRVGHDRRRIGVYEDHLVALLGERFAGLNARVVELAPLSDDDGAGADEKDFFKGGIARHGAKSRRV